VLDNSDAMVPVHAGAAIGAALLALIIIGAIVAAIVALVMLTTGGVIIARKTMMKIDEKHAFEGEVVAGVAVPMGSVFEPDEAWVAERLSSLEAQKNASPTTTSMNPMRAARPLSAKIKSVFSRLSSRFSGTPMNPVIELVEVTQEGRADDIDAIFPASPPPPPTPPVGDIDAIFEDDAEGAVDLGLVEEGAEDDGVVDA